MNLFGGMKNDFRLFAVVFVKRAPIFFVLGRVGPSPETPDGVSCEKDKVLS